MGYWPGLSLCNGRCPRGITFGSNSGRMFSESQRGAGSWRRKRTTMLTRLVMVLGLVGIFAEHLARLQIDEMHECGHRFEPHIDV